MAIGTPYFIHSTKSSSAGNGLGYSLWAAAVNDHAEQAIALRVNGLTNIQRQAAVDWMKGQLSGGVDGYPIGPVYDWGWTCKQVTGVNSLSGVTGYYCSELAWAAYKYLYEIYLDPDGSTWSWETAYGVSPSDLYEDADTTVIQTRGWDVDDCYYVKINLVGVYYKDDYDPWPKDAGETFMKWFAGDAWGGTSYITNNYYGPKARDGSGYLYW